MRLSRHALSLALAAGAACAGPSGTPAEWSVAGLDSPAAVGTAQPQLTAIDGRLVLSWVQREGATATLMFAERTGASGWSEPRVVASGDDWFVNWADVPSVARLADGTLAAHWLQKSGPGTYAYDVRLAFSKDHGRTWSASVTPHHDGTQTEHGFASLFQAPAAGLGLVWLDGRHMAGGHEGAGHDGHAAGAMTLRAATFDGAGAQIGESELDDRVCECCPTAIAVTAEGPIAAYRNRTEEEIRDIYVSRLVEGSWTPGVAVHADNWRVPACPVNGPALSARGRRVAIAWFTMSGGEPQAFVAFSEDSGATFGGPIRVHDAGTLGRVDVELLEDGAAAVSWIELAGEAGEFRVRRVTPSGELGPSVTVATLSATRSSGYPRMAAHDGALVFAWTATGPERGSPSQVRTAAITLAGTR